MFVRIIFSYLLFTVIYPEECDKIKLHLGTKTPYRIVANKNYEKGEYKEGCMKKIWFIARHGTRNPSASQIDEMLIHLPLLRDIILEKNDNRDSSLIKSDLELFRKWRPKLEEKDQKKLAIEGEHEMLELAERMQLRFPSLLSTVYSNTSYQFRFTKTQRTKLSAKSYAVGLFGKNTLKDVHFPEPIKQDLILRFYKSCAKWRSTVKENSASLEERKQFEQSDIMKATIKKVSAKLGLAKDVLSFDNLHLMYVTCAFETAWTSKRKSPWCLPFDLESIKVMEFAEDLKYYWIDGYGYNLTYRQACPTFRNMIDFFDDEAPYPKAVLYFTHSGTLLKLLAHLSLYRDTKPLTHSDFHSAKERLWRVSKIDTFGSNIAFILKRCEGGVSEVLVLHNENVVRLPSCPDNDFCDLQTVKKYYSESIESCLFNEMCENVFKDEE